MIEASQLPDGEKVYLKKSLGEWRVVHPLKNDDGTINWFNSLVGGWTNLIAMLFLLCLTLLFFYVYYHDTAEMQKVIENPCAYCSTTLMQSTLQGRIENFSKVNEEIKNKYDVNWSDTLDANN